MQATGHVPPRSDVLLASVLTVACVVELFASYAFEHSSATGPTPLHVAVAVVVGVSVAWRRIHPMLFAPFVTGLLAAQALVAVRPNVYGEVLVSLLALFGITAYASTRRTAVLSALAATALGAVMGSADTQDPVGEVVTLLLFGAVIMAAGWVVRRQRMVADRMREQRDLAEQRARAITATERARIARELHDVVAHGMSVVVLQARGGRHMVGPHPERAEQAFDDIGRVAADCLDEMRRLLGILRAEPGSEEPALAPQPRLPELESLVARARDSGARVELVVAGERRDLPPALELTAYRIAQEALTNVLKHAVGSAARIRLGYEPEQLTVQVSDDGPGSHVTQRGHGLIGMRERAELYGGTFEAGNEPGGGFTVRAVLPLTDGDAQ